MSRATISAARRVGSISALLVSLVAAPVYGDLILNENFNAATGVGGAVILDGSGFNVLDDFDTGLIGESAFAGTAGRAQLAPVSARGTTNTGVDSTGAAELDVQEVTFHALSFNFEAASGTGGGVFVGSNGTEGFTNDWDDVLFGENAFFGTTNGAALSAAGSVSAFACTTCGLGGSQGGRMIVDDVVLNGGTWFGGLFFAMGALPGGGGAGVLVNPGFEEPGPGPFFGAEGWTAFGGGTFTEVFIPRTGSNHLKIFGNVSGVFQDFAAEPGQEWRATCWGLNPANDALANGQAGALNIEWRNAGGTLISFESNLFLSAATPTGTTSADYIFAEINGIAPPGTTTARIVMLTGNFLGPTGGGAPYFDDATMELVGGGSGVNLAGISMTADVRGEAPGAGNILGDVQLRIEDPDGSALVFAAPASTSFQSMGGTLDTALEVNAAGITSNGAFDTAASNYNVVLAFENDTWGTGGILTLDNLIVTDNDTTGAAWFAGLAYDNLASTSAGLENLFLSADVLGDVPGGVYELRLEAIDVGSAGLGEDFAGVVGDEVIFLDNHANNPGVTESFTPGWDSGIDGEAAFGGYAGDLTLCDSNLCFGVDLSSLGFRARGVTTGDAGGGGAGEISQFGIAIFNDGGADWFGGLQWGGQALASTNLSDVVLTADVRGIADPFLGQSLGSIELRIEDADGDRLFVQVPANGSWQSIGGPLSTFTEGPAAGGGGDGSFDLDDGASYTVVVAFNAPRATWAFGGTIRVDNLFLTPTDTFTEIGRVAFRGVSDGSSFQQIGGLLSQATFSTLGDFEESFESASLTGGGIFVGSNGTEGFVDNWDDGLLGELAFFGQLIGASPAPTSDTGFVAAQACASCGSSGTAGGQLVVQSVDVTTGGWFSGLNWPGLNPPITPGNLGEIEFRADIRAATNGAGSTLGTITLRLEDPNICFLAFDVPATGSYQSVGGTLDTATSGCVSGGAFDFGAASYTATVLVLGGEGGTWGTGATVDVDNLFLTGVSLADAESLSVVVSYEEQLATWGTNGVLTVDNLILASVTSPDCDSDSDVDLRDFAFLQSCTTGGPGIPTGCECADYDGDGDIDTGDYRVFENALTGP